MNCLSTAASLLLTTATLSSAASAQRLLAIDTTSDIHVVKEASCDLLNSCTPMPPMPMSSAARGGIAFGMRSRVTWSTSGRVLREARPECSALNSYFVPNLIGLLATSAGSEELNGLALKESEDMLFFVTNGAVGEVLDPNLTGGALDPAFSVAVPAPFLAALPLTGVEHDPVDDTLWVIDCQYNVFHMERASAGGAVIDVFTVPTCASPTPWVEGITLNPIKKVPGHPRGVLTVSDSANTLYKFDRTGALIDCCTVPAGPAPIVGLAWKPKRPLRNNQYQ